MLYDECLRSGIRRVVSAIVMAYLAVILPITIAHAEEPKPLVFVGDADYSPLMYSDKGTPRGLLVDITRTLSERMGRPIDIRLMVWDEALKQVTQGKADAVCGISINETRKTIFDFSDPVYNSRYSIFVRTSTIGISKLEDLRGRIVGVRAGGLNHRLVEADPLIKPFFMDDYMHGFRLLRDGKLDAVIADVWIGTYILAKNDLQLIQPIGKPLVELDSAFAVKKGNTALVTGMNEAIRSMKVDGTLSRIYSTWQPEEVVFQTREQVMWKTLVWTTGFLAVLLIIAIAWIVTMKREIARRRHAEATLRESEEKFRLIAENTVDVISILDMNLRYTYVSPSIVRLRGFTTEEAVKETIDQIFTPESLKIVLMAFEEEKKMEAGGTADPDRIRTMELEEYKKDGSIIWVEASLSYLRDKDRKPVGILGVTRDITERKQANEERRNLEERLQRSEKMEALGQLAGGVAHDLNNVLGVLSGYSQLLLMEIPEGSPARGHAETILQSTVSGAAIIQDLLTIARRSVTASDVINLNSVVSGFLKTPVFEKMKDYHPLVTFRTECDKNLLNIKGSPVHLEKTLMNLVTNAAESISEKGEVTIRTESRYLDKAIKGYDEVKEGDYAVLTVSDTGMGIPAEDREKIFEPFYTKKTMGRSGTGLGLAIVWGTVKDHNGYIDVQTEVGKGSTFTLYFPVTREEPIAPQQKVPIEQYMGNGESVLVVDDIAEQRDVASGLLMRLGYQVQVVSSGEEAVEYLRGNKADILVLDMIMAPGIDGLETYERVLEVNPKQKAILVSGFSQTERVNEAQKRGAGAYVKKPYFMQKIGVAIRDELDRK
jgi:two-component system cell cycle sensor histidine kinase/response regulator CckA